MNKKRVLRNYDFSGLTILIAEDENFNRFYLKQLFKQTNAKVIIAKNGREALDHIEKNPDIKIALLDIKMPVMDGMEAAKIIKEKFEHIIVIALTAFAHELYFEPVFKESFDDYVFKPIHPGKLFKLIEIYSNQNTL
jgi:two-component system, cell cycle response regulator DivK